LKVTLTRTTDTFVELPTRPDLARRRKADLFVSLHFNSTESSRNSVQGAEVYCLTPAGASSTNARGEGGGAGWFPGNRYNDKNMFLAYQVQKALTKSLAVEDRGVRRARWAVLRDAVMPALLIEAGFMSHPVEGRKIFDASYRRQMAKAIVDGVLAYKRVVEQAADAVKAPSR
jgi:N-acetylmuramoyl-L-alanine amidase